MRLYLQQRTQQSNMRDVRMTAAMANMNAAIRERWVNHHDVPTVDHFKLKRFTEVGPRTSTRRGEKQFMSKSVAPGSMTASSPKKIQVIE